MPFETRYYNLEAFKWGEVYSARIDQRRFTIIDNQMAFISDQIGPGIIYGWQITNNEDGTISISPGMGIIGRRVYQSFGGYESSLNKNSEHYLYVVAKEGQTGGTSGNSEIVSVIGTDDIPPSSPSNLQQVTNISSYLDSLVSYDNNFVQYIRKLLDRRREEEDIDLISYKEIALTWDINTESDFSHYKIVRFDGSNETILGTTYETFYADINLSQDSDYIYHIIAVDLSGNESDTSIINVHTDQDIRIPSAPMFVEVFSGSQKLEVIWDYSPTDNVSYYRVVVQPLDSDYEKNGSEIVTDVDHISDSGFESGYVIFDELENNVIYGITVYAVSEAGYFSDGVYVTTILQYLQGAGEVNYLATDFSISDFENVGIEADVMWQYDQDDPYLPYAYKFLITFIENGNRFSEPIEVMEEVSSLGYTPDGLDPDNGIFYGVNVKYIPYRINGEIYYESIKEYTPYIIMIQTEDEDGNISNGTIIRIHRTIVSQPVSSIQDFIYTKKADNSIFLKWENPSEAYFAGNFITIDIINLGAGDIEGTSYIKDYNTGKSNSYVIPSSYFNINYRYHIEIIPYDVFDQQGTSYEIDFQFSVEDYKLRPLSPSNICIYSGDTELHLKWDQDYANDHEIAFYNIYRADFQFYLRSSDFSLINTVPSTITEFTDYTVVNNTSYSYFVTSVDIYGMESLNPINDNFMPSSLVSCTPSRQTELDPPTGLVVIQNSNSFDAELSWSAGTGFFDGYEILRSDGNNYSFQVVGYTPISQTSYIDENVLLVNNQTYYYAIRKYKSEVDLVVKTNSEIPSGSIFLGQVTTSHGTSSVSIDISGVCHIENFEDPLITKTNQKINVHHHNNDDSFDRRIELRSNIRVVDWETVDYQVYSTQQDIQGATNYFLKIVGTINENFFKDIDGNIDISRLKEAQSGESPVAYEIDAENSKIVFRDALYHPYASIICPYLSIPILSLEVVGISEVDNYLPMNKMGEISATQFESGQFDISQMPTIGHDGRKNEKLLPLKIPLKTLDNCVYSVASNYEDIVRNQMGTATIFYDIIQVENDKLLSATSKGILLSDNYGSDWEKIFSFDVAVHRLFRSNNNDYYAITNYGIYKNSGTSFRNWSEMGGLTHVKIIRDIIEDSSGNLYITTDLGVFKLNNEFVPYIEDTWQKLSIFGPRSSEAYGILYDEEYYDSNGSGRLIVSNELGILQSFDEGKSWSYIPEIESFIKIRKFIKSENYIFALSDNSLYRKDYDSAIFSSVSDLDISYARKMEIYNGAIYITTEEGVKVSNSFNIYADNDIDFVSEFSIMNVHNVIRPATSLNLIGNDLFIGTDRDLFIYNSINSIWNQYNEKNTIVPTLYIDGEEKKMGFYYNNTLYHNVSFDDRIDAESDVAMANKYDIYYSEFGGWVFEKYDAQFIVYQNDIEFGRSPSDIQIDKSVFVNLTLPSYTDNNAHKEKADYYKTLLQEDLDSVTSIVSTEKQDLVNLICNIYSNFELFLSQLYPEARVIQDDDGNLTNFILPSISVNLVNKRVSISNLGEQIEIEEPVYKSINNERKTDYISSVNIVNGMFLFDIPFDKYDYLTVDIYDVTVKNTGDYSHSEIEDKFELAYSGLPSYLSQVQQVNLVKMNLFAEKQWDGERNEVCLPIQSKSIIPVDTLWYDSLNSTFNYNKEVSNENINLSIYYPTVSTYVAANGCVLVGGTGGVISIDETTLEINEIDLMNIPTTRLIRDIFQYNECLYILTEKEIFVSYDYGIVWSEYNRNGLPNQLYSMGGIANNLIIGAEDGVYIKISDSDEVEWQKVISSFSPISIICSSNLLFVVVDGKIYLSSNGFTYSDTNLGEKLDITNIVRYGYRITYVSTCQGLYSDNSSFNSISPYLQEVDLDDLLRSNAMQTINDVDTNNSDMIAIAVSDGTYGIIQNDALKIKEFTGLDSIHKILIVNNDIWLFGHDSFKVPYIDYPIKLTTGAPL